MKKRFWKIEYSYTLLVIFAVLLFMLPTSFSSKNARYISRWNEVYNKLDYLFTAMSAQADSDIVLGLKKTKTPETREIIMMHLAKTYLELDEVKNIHKRYSPSYMNGIKVNPKDEYAFESYYVHSSGAIVGLKDLENNDDRSPGLVMSVDVNGIKGPNAWGKDIYGINIFQDGKITPLGYGKSVEFLKKDCSSQGSGVSCSHYYRIGGNFNE
jgi:hypothetical protein